MGQHRRVFQDSTNTSVQPFVQHIFSEDKYLLGTCAGCYGRMVGFVARCVKWLCESGGGRDHLGLAKVWLYDIDGGGGEVVAAWQVVWHEADRTNVNFERGA